MNKLRNIPALRQRIADITTQRQTITDAPRSHAETRARIEAWCTAQSAAADARIAQHVISAAYGSPIDEVLTVRAAPGAGMVDLAPVLASILGADVLASVLCRHLAQVEDGPTAADRAATLADIDAQLLAAEIEEEKLIEASEAAGAPIGRRPDASPAVVLGVWV